VNRRETALDYIMDSDEKIWAFKLQMDNPTKNTR
jgi:hypothetical protein